MPLLRSKKHPENLQAVTPEIWEKMKQNGASRRFVIESDEDIQITLEKIPNEVIDFGKVIDERQLVINELKSRGIKFTYNSKLETLKKKLDESKSGLKI
jgi:hypothetical protein